MSARQQVTQALIETAAVAVIRLTDPDTLLHVVDAVREGGVLGIEVTMTVPGALDQITAVRDRFGDDVVLGVGSVLDARTAREAVAAGARYVVSPVFKPEIITAAHALDAPALTGAFTPTECLAAQEAGADVVKVFPANVLGMAFFKAVLAPMPHLRLMPTGGVTLDNAGDWLRAGAVAVGVGSALLDKQAVAEKNWKKLTGNAIRIRESLRGDNQLA